MILTEQQEKLLEFVKEQHGEQKRKYTNEPYWTHPYNVAKNLINYTTEFGAVEIALCHDLFEDTKCTYEILRDKLLEFGYSLDDAVRICIGVKELTDCFTKESHPTFNRRMRKDLESTRLSFILPLYQSVKYADIIDNTISIAQHDIIFAKIYLHEKQQYISRMKNGNQTLYLECIRILNEAFNYINKLGIH